MAFGDGRFMSQLKKNVTLDFENTEIAFALHSDSELKRAQILFRMINSNFLAHWGPKFLNAALRIGLPVDPVIRKTLFAHFCGGETATDCLELVARLWQGGVSSILDYGVEGQDNEASFEQCVTEVMGNIDVAARQSAIPYCVFKPTGITSFACLENLARLRGQSGSVEDMRAKVEFERRFKRICQHAYDQGVAIMVDAEESWIQDPVDDLVEAMMRKYNREKATVFNTVQMYRVDRLEYLRKLFSNAKHEGFHVGVKLVRGAYMEKERARAKRLGLPSPIQSDKASTDKAFDAALQLSMENITCAAICAGTHNESSSRLLTELMYRQKVRCDDVRVSFAQLFGMSDHITFNLARHGYQVAKYLPYGPIKDVMPYLLRRAEENTSVQGQSSRELLLIDSEIKRRAAAKGELGRKQTSYHSETNLT